VSTASTPVVEVVEAQVSRLQLGAYRAVADHHPLRQSVEDDRGVAGFVSGSHPLKDSRPMKSVG
jgi:hypothetical protein